MKHKTWFYTLPLTLAVQGALAGTNLITDGGLNLAAYCGLGQVAQS